MVPVCPAGRLSCGAGTRASPSSSSPDSAGWFKRRPVATSNGGTERRAALQVSAHQCGSLITAESSRRWPARLRPARSGAPRRNRTYNPLAGSRVIRRPVQAASVLLSGGPAWFRSCLAMTDIEPCPSVSDDQSGDLINRPRPRSPASDDQPGRRPPLVDLAPRMTTPGSCLPLPTPRHVEQAQPPVGPDLASGLDVVRERADDAAALPQRAVAHGEEVLRSRPLVCLSEQSALTGQLQPARTGTTGKLSDQLLGHRVQPRRVRRRLAAGELVEVHQLLGCLTWVIRC